jgi:hypothetical protein
MSRREGRATSSPSCSNLRLLQNATMRAIRIESSLSATKTCTPAGHRPGAA